MSLQTAVEHLTTGWKEVLLAYPEWDTLESEYKKKVETFDDFMKIYPPMENIFRCFNYFEPRDTKVVLLGQDPYHGEGQAIGLCFGVEEEMKNPPSLRNIEKELLADVGVKLTSSTLENWAKQGVLLLNASLCVLHKSPGSCMKMWKPFTAYILDYLNKKTKKVVFVAWGAFAYGRLEGIDTEKHTLLVSSHPSPLSANRSYKQHPSFIGSHPFSRIHSHLEKIKW